MSDSVECRREFGIWTVRVNGHAIVSFRGSFLFGGEDKARAAAYEVSWKLLAALNGGDDKEPELGETE